MLCLKSGRWRDITADNFSPIFPRDTVVFAGRQNHPSQILTRTPTQLLREKGEVLIQEVVKQGNPSPQFTGLSLD